MEATQSLIIKILGHHGTSVNNVESIQINNFRESVDHEQWYGDGVYFFVDGLADPADSAFQFIRDNNRRDKKEEDEIAVLEAEVNVNNDFFLDLTQNDGLQLINSYRDELIAKIETVGRKPTTYFQDHDLIKSMRKELGIEFVKGNVYIRFGIQRDKGFRSIIPNVTIFVVGNPQKNIDKASIKRVA